MPISIQRKRKQQITSILVMGKSQPKPLTGSDSDSESDDGINIELLRQAADQELINDSMFKEAGLKEQKSTIQG